MWLKDQVDCDGEEDRHGWWDTAAFKRNQFCEKGEVLRTEKHDRPCQESVLADSDGRIAHST